MLCILRHRGGHLILAYIWAWPAILAAGKDRGGTHILFLHYYSFSSFSPVSVFHLLYYLFYLSSPYLGWSGGAKVSCILCHRGVQLILAYSWARPAILVAGKGREVMFLFLLFLHCHSCSSFFPVPLFHLFCYLFCRFFSHSLGDDTKWPTRVDVSLNPNTINLLFSGRRGVVGWCEGVLYLTSPGRPTDIGLLLGKACYPCSR